MMRMWCVLQPTYGMSLTPIFDQYLRHYSDSHSGIAVRQGTVSYRWKVDEPGFQMPVRVGKKDNWQLIKEQLTGRRCDVVSQR